MVLVKVNYLMFTSLNLKEKLIDWRTATKKIYVVCFQNLLDLSYRCLYRAENSAMTFKPSCKVSTTNVTEQKWSNLESLVQMSSFNLFRIVHE